MASKEQVRILCDCIKNAAKIKDINGKVTPLKHENEDLKDKCSQWYSKGKDLSI